MCIRLIVNGDDFARCESNTVGIVEAYRRGILTSTTVVANGDSLALAAALSHEEPELGVGIHLVLDEYLPVCDPGEIPSLVDSDGRFLKRMNGLLRLQTGRASLDELSVEWAAQIAKVVSAGIVPTHIDGHGHCHVLPAVVPIVLDLARRYNIAAVRLPSEPLSYLAGPRRRVPKRFVEKCLVKVASAWAARHYRGSLESPDYFYGFMEGGGLALESLERIAVLLKPGVSELMVHPAVDNSDQNRGLAYNWRMDYEAVTAYTRDEFQERFGVELVSYARVWR